MTNDSELESLQCAPFHAPPAVGKWDVRARNLCLQSELERLTGRTWCVSCSHDEHNMHFTCMSPDFMLGNLPLERYVRQSHDLEPEQWTRPEIEKLAVIIAEIFRQEQARG